MNPKNHKKNEGCHEAGSRVRKPALVSGFATRVRKVFAELKVRQGELADTLGCRPETISRLCGEKSGSIAIDLLISLVGWAEERGVSARWLVLGAGPMSKADMPSPTMASEMTNAIAYAMLLEMGRRCGINVEGIARAWFAEFTLPGGDIATLPVKTLADRLGHAMDNSETGLTDAPSAASRKKEL